MLTVDTCSSNSFSINRRQYENKIVALLWLMLPALRIRSKLFTFGSQKFKVAAVICTSVPPLIHDRYLGLPQRYWQMSRTIENFWNIKLKYLEQTNPSNNFLTTDSTWTVILSQNYAKSNSVSTGSWLRHQLSVIDWIPQVMPQERIDGETRKETGRYDQLYGCNPAPWTSCLLLTTIITVICKSKRQFSSMLQFLVPSVLCGFGVIYCSLLLHPETGPIRTALSVLQLSSCRIRPTDCHLRSRTVVFLKSICRLFLATKLSGLQDHKLKLKLK